MRHYSCTERDEFKSNLVEANMSTKKHHHEGLSEAEWTSWVIIIVLFALIVLALFLFWQKVSG
jgi:hypothetical protein